jgi:hypothetical protein
MNIRHVLGVVASVLVLGACVVEAGEEEVRIKGKPLSTLIKQLTGTNRGLQVRAARALAAAPEEVRPKVAEKLIPILKSKRENDRFAAAQTLGQYGPAAKAAVPNLLPMLEGTQYERNRAGAAKALGLILKDSEPSPEIENVTKKLIAIFRDQYPDVQRESVKACGMIGPAAKACIPHLVEPLQFTLGNVGRDNPYKLVRRATAWTLGRMGPLAKGYIDRLIAKMHAEGRIMPEVPEAIGRIGCTHENVVPNMVDFLEKMGRDWRHSPESKMNTWIALEKFGEKSAPAVPLIARYLREGVGTGEPPELFIQWFKVLSAIGPKAKDALPGVKKWANAKKAPGGWDKEKFDELRKGAAAAADKMK